MICIACGSKFTEDEVGVRAEFIVKRTLAERTVYSNHCFACNTRWCTPRLTESQMQLLYTNYRQKEYDQMRERIEPDYVERKHSHLGFRPNTLTAEYLLQPYLKNPRILDVGGYDGLNTPLRQIADTHHVYDLGMVEPVEGAEIVKLPDPPYDLVVLSHVLEHVASPLDFLRDWSQHSCKMVYIEVPHADLRNNPTHWHEHLTMFSPAGVIHLMKHARLALCDLKIKNRAILAVGRVQALRAR